ncbi:MAG: hypothetical protein Q4P20_00060 [Eubacteriales bacterium]|nr:hypothetical protein [Eubacteriales bacterium]
MRINRRKLNIAMARACMKPKDIVKAGIPRGTWCRSLNSDVSAATVGKIARALGVDVLDIIEQEEKP